MGIIKILLIFYLLLGIMVSLVYIIGCLVSKDFKTEVKETVERQGSDPKYYWFIILTMILLWGYYYFLKDK